MKVNIEPSWAEILKSEFDKEYFVRLTQFVKAEYRQHTCYPPGNEIFNAFNLCPISNVKVVILGQDPYHGPGQAEGLCFSVKTGIDLPPSLINIFKEIKADIGTVPRIVYREPDGTISKEASPRGFCPPGNGGTERGAKTIEGLVGAAIYDGSLRRWAEQGVFLLNTCLSVREHQAFSHSRQGWETFTDAVIQAISQHCPHVVFLLWGGPARTKKKFIDTSKHLVLESVHPSPLSANRGGWFGNHHFSQCNNWLQQQGLEPIRW